MSISRRTALTTGAALVTTGAITAPLAIKVALASASDARIFALIEERDRTFAEMRKAHDRCGKAAVEKMPPPPGLAHISLGVRVPKQPARSLASSPPTLTAGRVARFACRWCRRGASRRLR